jgi:transitional endoplasmic reticulum ATPase
MARLQGARTRSFAGRGWPECGTCAQNHYEAEVNEFLTQLNECATRRILVVAATNRPDKIDAAVLRPGRIDKRFFVGPPDLEARIELFRLQLAERPAAGIDYLALGRASDMYTPAEIREIVNQAARWALESHATITHGHLARALAERRPALKADDVERRRIGFSDRS